MTVMDLLEAVKDALFETPVILYSNEYGDYYEATKASFTEEKDAYGVPTGKCFIVK